MKEKKISIILISLFPLFLFIGCSSEKPKLFGEKEHIEYGQYFTWNWTPDGRIIYVKRISRVSHTKGAGSMGYQTLGLENLLCIINPDGTENKVIKRIPYKTVAQKIDERAEELLRENKDLKMFQAYDIANKEDGEGKLPKDPVGAHLRSLDWSPVNNLIVFYDDDYGIGLMDKEGNVLRYLDEKGSYPVWSPDGKQIAYVISEELDGMGEIWTMNADGSKKHGLGVDGSTVSWSPDGEKLVVGNVCHEDINKAGIFIVNIDGTNYHRIEEGGGGFGPPSWSPDGKWIIYYGGIMKSDGSEDRWIQYIGFHPKWSPDGKQLLMGCGGGLEILDFVDGKLKNIRVIPKGNVDKQVVEYFSVGR